MHRASVRWLAEEIEKRRRQQRLVIVTHHAPSARSLDEGYSRDHLSPAFASALDGLVEASGASLWLHGHTHRSADYVTGGTRVLSNPRGYHPIEPNPAFEPGLVVTI
jgi:Icc-related predicted phosphoesterase